MPEKTRWKRKSLKVSGGKSIQGKCQECINIKQDKMKTKILFLALVALFFSCKKEELQTLKQTPPVVQTPLYDSITYKCYGGHTWYEIDYIERGIQYHINPSDSNRVWEYSFTDTVGALKRLVYASSLDNDTMTALIIINGITTDSVTVVGASMEVSLSRN